jgi:transcriptional antiterminator NusG
MSAKVLRSKGFEEFVPLYVSRRQWSDRKKNVALPLFSTYIFSRFCSNDKRHIMSTPGVIRVVGSSNGPLPIADKEIEAIQRAAQAGANVQPRQYQELAVGSRVRVKEGPLTGCEGTLVVAREGGAKLIISMDMIQRSMAVELNGCAVEPIINNN